MCVCGVGGCRGGGGGVCKTMNPTLHCHHQTDVCLKLANNESHFNVSGGGGVGVGGGRVRVKI